MRKTKDIAWMEGDHIIPYHPIPKSGQRNGTTTRANLQMLCRSCNLEKKNHPYSLQDEQERLKKVYEMTDEEWDKLPYIDKTNQR